MATFYDFENRTAFNPETGEGTPNAVGQVYAKTDTTFSTPLVVTLMGSGLSVTDLHTDQYCQLQGFQAADLVQVVFKSGDFTKVLNTTTPLVGPAGPAVADAVDNGDGTVTFTLPDGSPAATVALPPGPQGDPGPAGLPATGAADDDAALATYLTTPGTVANTALNTTARGIIAGATAPFDKLLPSLTIGFGDSITEAGSNPNTSGQGERSYFAQAAVLSNQRIKYYRNAGIAGNTVEQMWNRIETDVIAYRPDRVIFMGGTNNMGLTDQTGTQATVRLILDRLLEAGIWTAVVSIPPGDGLAEAGRQRILDHNAFLKAEAQKRGMLFIDVFALLVDPATGGFKTGYATDGVHPSATGARIMGQAVVDALFGRYPEADKVLAQTNTDTDNLLTNGQFVTDATADGVPDGWVFAGGANGTCTLVTDAAVLGKAVELTRTVASGSTSLAQNITSLAAGDAFELAVKFKPTGSAVYSIYAAASDAAFTQLSMHKPVNGWSSAYDGYITAYIRGTYPTGATRLQVVLHTASGLGSVRFGQIKVKKLNATVTAPTPPPAETPVALVTTTSEPSLLLNPLFADADANGTPENWFVSGSVTPTVGSDAAVTGNVLTLTRTGSTGSGAASQNVDTGWAVGDQIELGIKYSVPTAGPVVNIYALCADVGGAALLNTKLVNASSASTAGFVTVTARFTIPANTTRIQYYVHTASGTGTLKVGQATLRKKVA